MKSVLAAVMCMIACGRAWGHPDAFGAAVDPGDGRSAAERRRSELNEKRQEAKRRQQELEEKRQEAKRRQQELEMRRREAERRRQELEARRRNAQNAARRR